MGSCSISWGSQSIYVESYNYYTYAGSDFKSTQGAPGLKPPLNEEFPQKVKTFFLFFSEKNVRKIILKFATVKEM